MGVVALTDIQDFVANLAREFLPEKVILFGSNSVNQLGRGVTTVSGLPISYFANFNDFVRCVALTPSDFLKFIMTSERSIQQCL